MTTMPRESSIRWPRMLDNATWTSPSGSTPTARAAATAASALTPHVGRREGQRERGRQLGDVAARAEGHGRHVAAPVRVEQRLVGRDDRGAAGPQAGDQLGLGRGHALDAAEQFEVDGADVDDHADVRLGDRRQLGDLARAAHRHLEHEHLGPRRRAEDGQRQPDLGVEVRAVATTRRCGASIAASSVLRRRLARRPGDPDDLGAEPPAPCGREAPEGGERVVGGEQRAGLRAARRRRRGRARPARPSAPRASACAAKRAAVRRCRRAGRRRGRPGRPRASR